MRVPALGKKEMGEGMLYRRYGTPGRNGYRVDSLKGQSCLDAIPDQVSLLLFVAVAAPIAEWHRHRRFPPQDRPTHRTTRQANHNVKNGSKNKL
jgi:hypothetical protein